MGKLALNVYLLRGEIDEPLKVVDVSKFTEKVNISAGDGATAELFYGESESPPEWFTQLKPLFDRVGPQDLRTRTVGGVLTCKVDDRWFVASFGHGWQRIKTAAVEPNFGIRCVLNLCKKDGLKAIRRDRISDDYIQAIEQIPDEDDIFRFGIDVDRDLLRGVKAGSPKGENFGPQVVGSDAFKAEIDLGKETISSFLNRCLSLYSRADYKSNFSWIDNVSAVRDAQLIAELERRLVRAVGIGISGISLCVPEFLSWDGYDTFSFSPARRGQAPVSEPLTISQWKASAGFKSAGARVAVADLTSNFVYARSTARPELRGKWTLLECLHGVIKFKRERYLAHGGQWFRIAAEFVKQIDEKLAQIPESTLTFPSPKLAEPEGEYNERVSKASASTFQLLDKKNVMHGGGKSRIEICDLLTADGQMVCVKPWGGSSGSLSHLFQQALVSAQLVYEDEVFQRSASAKIKSSHKSAWKSVCDPTVDTEIVLAVLRGPKKEHLPFFAKVSMVTTASALKRMRFRPSYKAVI